MKTPAVLYAAKSTADKKASIPAQLDEGRKHAESEDLEVVASFKDEKKSAYSGDRGHGLVGARAEAERLAAEHGECALIIQHSDRLARGDGKQAAHLVEYALWAIKAGVKIVSIQDPETFAQDDLIYAVLSGHRNHEDSKRKSAASKAGRDRRRAKGLFGGGPCPFGYSYNKQDQALVVLQAEAVIVRRVFEEFVGGKSLSAIARTLENDGVSTRRGKHWRSSTISQIISNPTYIGKQRHFEEVHDAQHEPIIEVEVWEEAQVLLAARRKGGRGRPPKGNHLLRGGLLKCECGGTRICRSESDYESYQCEKRIRFGTCGAPHLARRVVDAALYSYFERVGLDVEATRAQLSESRDRKLVEVRALLSQAEGQKHRAEERLSRVRRDYTDGRISAEDWADFRAELTTELKGASAEVERLARQKAEAESWGMLQDSEQDTLARLADLRGAMAGEVKAAADVDAVRAALIRLFDHFIVRRVQPGSRVHADLAWVGDLIIEPIVREEVIEGFTKFRPIFRREPLYDAQRNTGSPSPRLDFSGLVFGPIPISLE